MIELDRDQLTFSFPSVLDEIRTLVAEHARATLPRILAEDRGEAIQAYFDERPWLDEGALCSARDEILKISDDAIRGAFDSKVDGIIPKEIQSRIEFQRTLRIPDDGKTYFLPPGLGRFPLRHVDDYGDAIPPNWLERGGVLMPMYQSEALWLNFRGDYPVAIKIGAGKINAVTGEGWRGGLHRRPQDYLVTPAQPWLDGFAVSKGVIRQFVATPLGEGHTVEEQLTGGAESGGIQIQAYPMKGRRYFERNLEKRLPTSLSELLPVLGLKMPTILSEGHVRMCLSPRAKGAGMGLGMGGQMRQEIYKDPHGPAAWDLEGSSRCFVHLCDALRWREITGDNPPQAPPTAKEYEMAGLPWFDYYRDDLAVLEGSETLAALKSISERQAEGKASTAPDDAAVTIPAVLSCGPKKRPEQVREWVE
jgi:hypothetical protein